MSTDIAIYLPSFRGGGAERIMVTLANEISKQHSVDLVMVSSAGPFLSEVSPRVRLIDLKSKRVSSSLPALIRYLRKENPKAMLSALNHANIIAIIAKKLSRCDTRLFVSEHNNLSLSKKRKETWRTKVVYLLMKRLYPLANGIVAVSEGVRDDLITMFKTPSEKTSAIYNPIVTPKLLEMSRESIMHPWFREGEPPVIIGVGRLTPQKDFATLVKAFAVARAKKDCRLIVLGEGELKDDLKMLAEQLNIAESVQFPGFAKNPYAWMARSDLFVMSSAWEGFGNVLVEAMACGTAVISTDCPSGPSEILENGKWGRLVPVGDPGSMANAILETLSNPVMPAEELIRRARDFDSQKIAVQYMKLLA